MPYHYLVLLVAVFTLACGQTSKPAAFGPGKMDPNNGDFGFSLDTLRKHYAAPEKPGESNYFIDLWAEQNLKILAYECKLTNNHALFINSHGGGVARTHGTRYAFYPHQSLLGPKEKAPYF